MNEKEERKIYSKKKKTHKIQNDQRKEATRKQQKMILQVKG
jgi:hypothetical protein